MNLFDRLDFLDQEGRQSALLVTSIERVLVRAAERTRRSQSTLAHGRVQGTVFIPDEHGVTKADAREVLRVPHSHFRVAPESSPACSLLSCTIDHYPTEEILDSLSLPCRMLV